MLQSWSSFEAFTKIENKWKQALLVSVEIVVVKCNIFLFQFGMVG